MLAKSLLEASRSMNLTTLLTASLLCLSGQCLAGSTSFIPTTGKQPYVVSPSGKTEQLYSQSAALIISASQYAAGASGWQKLPATRREMDAISEALSKQGFEITRIHDPTRETIIEETQKFLGKYGADEKARLLFYYSGHGYTSESTEMGYIVPVNARNPSTDYPKFISQAISLESFSSWVRQFKAKHFLLVFDSCFSGSIFKTKSNTRVPLPRPIDWEGRWRYLKTASDKSARQFISAGGPNEELPATSTFTRLFLQGVQGDASSTNDGYVTGKELGLYLEQNVSTQRAGKQNPISGLPPELNSSAGDFIFQFQEAAQTTSGLPIQENISAALKNPEQVPPPQTTTARNQEDPRRAYNLSLVLSETAGKYLSDHEQAIRTLYPLIPADLSGKEVAKILGTTSLSYRATGLRSLLPKIPPRSIPGDSVAAILGSEDLSYRVNLVNILQPFIAPDISESDAAAILGGLYFSDRKNAINLIAKLIKKPISLEGIRVLLNNTHDSDRPQLVLLLSN